MELWILSEEERVTNQMANLNLKFTRTLKMKADGVTFHADLFPKRGKIYDELNRRRRLEKPLDGRAFKDAGDALKEMQKKGVR